MARTFRMALIATITVLTVAASHAQAKGRCSVWAHVTDPDPKGANIRALPTSKSRAVARLKKSGRSMPIVKIIRQKGAWFQIEKAEVRGSTIFTGRGFIHRSLVAVQMRGGAPMYAGPSRSRKLPYGAGDAEADGRLLACRGGWVRVYHSELKKRGWLHSNDHCPDMGTTCS